VAKDKSLRDVVRENGGQGTFYYQDGTHKAVYDLIKPDWGMMYVDGQVLHADTGRMGHAEDIEVAESHLNHHGISTTRGWRKNVQG